MEAERERGGSGRERGRVGERGGKWEREGGGEERRERERGKRGARGRYEGIVIELMRSYNYKIKLLIDCYYTHTCKLPLFHTYSHGDNCNDNCC